LCPHLHVVVLDGAYVEDTDGALHFEATRAPTESDMAFVSTGRLATLGAWESSGPPPSTVGRC